MSRSYKKNPIIKDNTRGMKKVANRKVRRTKDIPLKGTAYKKAFPQYDIHDWICRYTYQDYMDYANSERQAYENGGLGYDANKYTYSYGDWYKTYKAK